MHDHLWTGRDVVAVVGPHARVGDLERTVRTLSASPLVGRVLALRAARDERVERRLAMAGARVTTLEEGSDWGAVLQTALAETDAEILTFVGDLPRRVGPSEFECLLDPILEGTADHTVAGFRRDPLVEHTVRPLFEAVFPEVTACDPLPSVFALRRRCVTSLSIGDGPTAPLGLQIDIALTGGRVEGVGLWESPRRTTEDLRDQVRAVVREILRKAHEHGRLGQSAWKEWIKEDAHVTTLSA